MKDALDRAMDRVDDLNHDVTDVVGQPITLVTREIVDYDDLHNDPIRDDVEVETRAEVQFPEGAMDYDVDEAGVNASVDAIVIINDDHDVYTGAESDVRSPTRVETANGTFDVFHIVDEQNGLLRLFCNGA